MEKVNWSLRVVLFVGLLQAVSCTKTVDTITNDSVSLESSSNATVANEFSNCKMRRIHQDFGGGPSDTKVNGLFTYNSAGNPISLIYNINGTGNSNHYFIYGAQNRLREYHQRYGSFIVVRHQYGYNASNQIVKDTMTNKEAGGTSVSVSTLEYDAMGRIIKETIVNLSNEGIPVGPVRRPTFTYDNRGNLAVKEWKSSWYDNKVSAFRAHPLFMFLMRNYSMNNAAVQAKYNSKGLPLSLSPGNDALFNSSITHKIVYDCQ